MITGEPVILWKRHKKDSNSKNSSSGILLYIYRTQTIEWHIVLVVCESEEPIILTL